MIIRVPEFALILLIGPTSSGKSTFAAKHFLPTETVSSDFCRALVSDDATNQHATHEAFEVLGTIVEKRLQRGRLTVIDATNVAQEDRRQWLELARRHHATPVAIVFDLPEKLLRDRHKGRDDRDFPRHVLRRQIETMRRNLKNLKAEGFRRIFEFSRERDVNDATVEREPMRNNLTHERGPFDIIGDVHGCFDELVSLLRNMGYTVDANPANPTAVPPAGRKAVFVGDLVDRGPNSPAVLRLVMAMVEAGTALCVPGNHDAKLVRALNGRNVKLKHGLKETMEQLEPESAEFKTRVVDFLDGLTAHIRLDGGQLVVAHAGLKESLQGRSSGAVRDFCLYGETTGETDEFGLPVRLDWARNYRGQATVVYGHTPVMFAEWVNRTICIDTGCVFGGKLTALRWPEMELAEVPAAREYYPPSKPLKPAGDRPYPDLLDVRDVLGKRHITTRLMGQVTVFEEHAIAALEIMSRFAVDPHWLIYLPPTMSPSETAPEGSEFLEHPRDAFDYFRRHGIAEIVCEEKHMGSRAVAVVCRNEAAAKTHFGAEPGRLGVIYTRTGRAFFTDAATEAALISRLAAAMDSAGLWDELETDWICLDAELMPWSAKAQELLRTQYAAVGAAGRHGLQAAVDVLHQAAARFADETGSVNGHEGGSALGANLETATAVSNLLADFRGRHESLTRYVAAYRGYCWPVAGVDDLKFAPFHILATQGRVHTDRDHVWHMETLAQLCAADSALLRATPFRVVPLADEAAEAAAIEWWENLTASGGEGMVVKPRQWISRDKRGLVQPALKCRGPEYLRIIYGPEYRLPKNIERLRGRYLNRKRALARKEFALGLEALHRFVAGEPLYRVHECVFAVLAMESEPVDPRL